MSPLFLARSARAPRIPSSERILPFGKTHVRPSLATTLPQPLELEAIIGVIWENAIGSKEVNPLEDSILPTVRCPVFTRALQYPAMGGLHIDKLAACATAGLGCFLACILCALLGQFPFPDFAEARACQLPLTLSGDAGCLVGVAVCAVAHRTGRDSSAVDGYGAAFASAGLCLSYLLRSGYIVGANQISLVVGDFLSGMFTMLCVFGWWKLLAPLGESAAVRRLAGGLGLAGALFLLMGIIPSEASRLIASIVFPMGMCVCLLPLIAERTRPAGATDREAGDIAIPVAAHDKSPCENEAPELDGHRAKAASGKSDADAQTSERAAAPSSYRLPHAVIATVALACFVVDLAMALFPVCLYHEASPLLASIAFVPADTNAPIGTLTQPAALCAILVVLSAAALYAFERQGAMPLPPLYYVGFAMTAFNYLAFPYHFTGGIPLAVAEAGRVVIALFILVMTLRLYDNRGGDAEKLLLKVAAIAFAVMLAADALAVAVQLQPGFDYADFQFRTIFAGIGTAVLVVLLLGPLPRVNAAIAPLPSSAASNAAEEDAQPDLSLEERFERACENFAADHKLSARETEVFTLIANGRDVPYIERELVLAKSTVKTHIKHIYEKCGVSSRQDLLDMFESYRG